MPSIVPLNFRALRLTQPVVLLLASAVSLCGTEPSLLAQTQATPAAQTTAAQTPQARTVITYDPTKPEVQPNLNVDQDPIISPDLPEKPAEAATTGTGRAGEIQKGKGGVYTLHEDVNEVVLNCTVVNQKGKLVTDLKRNEVSTVGLAPGRLEGRTRSASCCSFWRLGLERKSTGCSSEAAV